MFAVVILFCLFSIILSIFDIKSYHIPLLPIYIGVISTIIINFIFFRQTFFNNISGMISMTLFFFLMRIITKGGMGFGDIQYALYCGLISGFPNFIFSSLFASLFGIFFYFVFIKSKNNTKKIPFIPAMFLGTIFKVIFIL